MEGVLITSSRRIGTGSVVTFLTQEVLLVGISNSLHPLFVHQLDVGPFALRRLPMHSNIESPFYEMA